MAGDALEMATVKRALSGVDVVIQSLGVSAGPEIIFKPTQLFSNATRMLITAMEETHVKRLIAVPRYRFEISWSVPTCRLEWLCWAILRRPVGTYEDNVQWAASGGNILL